MARPKTYPSATEVRLISVRQIAVALGWTEAETRRRLAKHSNLTALYQRYRIGARATYDPQVLDVLRNLYGQQPAGPPSTQPTWLDIYEGDTRDRT